jgi:hypothetical protein
MDQAGPCENTNFGRRMGCTRKSQGARAVRHDMRYVLLLVLIALLVFLSNQLWILFEGVPLF